MPRDPQAVKSKQDRPKNQDPTRLRRRRVAKRLSITALAARAGCSVSYLWQLENGDYSASPEMLGQLADALGCDITDLMPPEPGAVPPVPKAQAKAERKAA